MRLVTKQVTAEVGMTNKMAQKWLTLIGICSFCLLSFHLAIKGQFIQHFDYTLIVLQRFNYTLIIFSLKKMREGEMSLIVYKFAGSLTAHLAGRF